MPRVFVNRSRTTRYLVDKLESVFQVGCSCSLSYLQAIMAHTYTRLESAPPASPSSAPRSAPSRPKTGRYWRFIAFGTFTSLLAISFFVAATTQPRPTQQDDFTSLTKPHRCGNSSDDARALGCHFDIMSFTWSHPRCFDKKLMDEFLSLKNWTWWDETDQNDGKPVPFKEVSLGQHTRLYVSWEYHITHCTFMWKKMHRAVLAGRPLDSYVGRIEHTMHCTKTLLERNWALDDRNTIIRMKFPECMDS